MNTTYHNAKKQPLTRSQIHSIPPEKLREESGLNLHIIPTLDEIYSTIADIMIEVILQNKGKRTTMILPVGPTAQYPHFARKIAEQKIDCSNLWTFNMDEFLDRTGKTISTSHPMSFRKIMQQDFFEKIPSELRMPENQMIFPRHDNMEEVDRILDEIAPHGVDLCLAGVGPEGHFAFNEDPNWGHLDVSDSEFLNDRTKLVPVNLSTVDMDALVAGSGDRSAIPPFAVTLGPHDILRAKRMEVIFFAGPFQRFALREVLFREPTMHFPGTYLKKRKQHDGSLTDQNITIWSSPIEARPVTSQTIS